MLSLGLKTSLLWLLSLTVATELVQGAPKCLRTNRKPSSACASECLPNIGCHHKRKVCLCDGDCGYSCINPNQTCSRPRVRNGRVRFNSLRFNATQTTTCKSGFHLFGSKTRTCRGNGFWDGRISRCRKLEKLCTDPGTPGLLMRFRYASKTGFKPGTTLIYYCPPTFSLVGSQTLSCGQDGKWSSSLPVCQTPKCNQAVPPPNSYIVRPKNWRRLRDYGVRLILGCKPGYARGAQRGQQVCVTPGWKLEPSSFKCFPKSCSDPGRPMNGNRKGLFVFREKVYFTCDKCYKLNGPEYRQCQANQKWSDSLPTCDPAVCPSLRSPANGRITGKTPNQCGSSIQYSCFNGYQLDGPRKRTCQSDGTWSGKETTCQSKGCSDPGEPRNGQRRGLYAIGQKVSFTCNKCYKLIGSSHRQCQANRRWSGSQPKCESVVCPFLRSPANGRITGKTPNQCGNSIQYSCFNGYQLDGPRKRTCQSDGTWSGKETTCQSIGCSDPGEPRNGQRRGLYTIGQKISFTCNKCYKLRGSSHRQCQANRRWSGSQPKCEPVVCPSLRSPANGRITGKTPNQCGNSIKYSCFNGYQLDGPRKRICQSDGTWRRKNPKCQSKNGRKWLKSHAKKSTTKPTSKTTKATTTKVPTTVKMTPTPTVRLQSPCGYPNLPPEARIRLVRGRTLLIACQKQYSVVSPGIMLCNRKSWKTYKNVTCLPKGCAFPGVPKNGVKHGLSYLYNDVIKLSCDICYTLSGHGERKCLTNGTWSHSQPKCVLKTCPPLKNTTKAMVDHVSLNCGATAIYQCMGIREVMLGSGERTCGDDGTWTGSEPKCVDRNFNIALGKPTLQSSYDRYWTGPGSRAVDGNRHPYYYRKSSCTHTKREYGPWWRVDLGKEEPVAMVIIVNRKNCCHDRLNDFEVSVGNHRDARKNSRCGGRSRPGSGEIIELKCPRGLRGRYVSVYLPNNNWTILTLCEVEIYRRLIF